MRQGANLYYLLSDHLGSTQVVTDDEGAPVEQQRYKAFGEVRGLPSYQTIGLTDYTFTGQYSNFDDFGLMYYNARWYDPALGRMAQADSIVPAGPQGYDRYAYVNNSPVNFTDPSGHGVDCGMGMDCIGEYGKTPDDRGRARTLDNNLLDWFPVVGDIRSIVRGIQMTENASSVRGFWEEQAALQGWYNNCYGRCHYSFALDQPAESTDGGPMPSTPLVDLYSAGMAESASGLVGLGQTAVLGGFMRGMPEPKLNTPRFGIRIAPFGNRNPTGPLASKLPHFHIRVGTDFGSSYHGLGWKTHHPWDDITQLLEAIFGE